MIATAMVKAPQNRLPDLGILLISIVGFFTKTFSPTCSIDTPAVCRDCGGWNSRAKNKKRVAWPPREPHPLIEQFASGHSSMETLVTQGDHWISLVSLGRAMLQSASNFSLGASAQWGNDGFCSTDGHGSNVSASATVKHRHLDAVMRLTRLCAAEQADVQKMWRHISDLQKCARGWWVSQWPSDVNVAL